jgi:hypothetical protein
MKILKEDYSKEGQRWLAGREGLKREVLVGRKDNL